MNDLWLNTFEVCLTPSNGGSTLARIPFLENPLLAQILSLENPLAVSFIDKLLGIAGALAILIAGWLIATVVASIVKGLLNRTEIDNKLAEWVTGNPGSDVPIEKWAATIVYWLILLAAVSMAVQNFGELKVAGPLQDIFGAIPEIIGAIVLGTLAWLVACIAKALVVKGLGGFNLDDRLAAANEPGEGNSFLVNETLGEIVYWLILLLFLPLIVSALPLDDNALAPLNTMVTNVINVLPKVLGAIAIGFIGWLVARIVKNIVTNLLRSLGADSLDDRLGIPGSFELSKLGGTLAYLVILVPSIIAALEALGIATIYEPARDMLTQITTFLPLLISAAFIIGVFYFIGRLISEIVATFLTALGFDNLFEWLGISGLQATIPAPAADGTPEPYVRESEGGSGLQGQTPSKIAGTLVLVGFVLVGLNTAVDVLQLDQLTEIVEVILGVSARVLVGVVVFAIGLFCANFVHRLIASAGTSQSNMLAQAARISILVFVGAMALQLIGVAPSIVNLAFGLLLGAIAVAIAIAFGLGGRDVANEEIRGFLNSFKGR